LQNRLRSLSSKIIIFEPSQPLLKKILKRRR
jgi:hypothetical protein